MPGGQAEMLLKVVEVAVGMQELDAVLDAPCGDDDVDDPANGDPALAEAPIVCRSKRGEPRAAHHLATDRRERLFDVAPDSIPFLSPGTARRG